MNIKNFKNIHQNENIFVLAKGESLLYIDKNIIYNNISIGVNDIGRYIIPTYLVIQDNITKILQNACNKNQDIESYKKQLKIWNNPKYKYIFTCQYNQNKKIFKDKNRTVPLYTKNYNSFKLKHNNNDDIYHSFFSPFLATYIAIYMGAKNIFICGLDMNSNNIFKNPIYPAIISNRDKLNIHFERLVKYNSNLNFYNVSPSSYITAIPKIKPEDIFYFL